MSERMPALQRAAHMAKVFVPLAETIFHTPMRPTFKVRC
jgi:hypothetical protein